MYTQDQNNKMRDHWVNSDNRIMHQTPALDDIKILSFDNHIIFNSTHSRNPRPSLSSFRLIDRWQIEYYWIWEEVIMSHHHHHQHHSSQIVEHGKQRSRTVDLNDSRSPLSSSPTTTTTAASPRTLLRMSQQSLYTKMFIALTGEDELNNIERRFEESKSKPRPITDIHDLVIHDWFDQW